jgi:hypothetical protein
MYQNSGSEDKGYDFSMNAVESMNPYHNTNINSIKNYDNFRSFY